MIRETFRQCPADLDALFLPIQCVGKSNEHLRSPGTLTLTAGTALRAWTEIGEAVHRAGLRKLVFVNSHGGNVDLMNIVCRELRVRCGMLAVASSWSRLGSPPGVYTDKERAVGIHGGDAETSLMLHFRPELVKMAQARTSSPARSRSPRPSTSCARPASPLSPGSPRISIPTAPPATPPSPPPQGQGHGRASGRAVREAPAGREGVLADAAGVRSLPRSSFDRLRMRAEEVWSSPLETPLQPHKPHPELVEG